MRVMAIVKATKDSEAGVMPSEELLAEMGKFNEEMVKAGVLLAGEGLHPSSKGARVSFGGDGKRTVIDGPFAETKELIAGYWLMQVRSLRGGGRVGQALPQPAQRARRDRDPSGLRGRGLRRGVHARAARAGGAHPGPGGAEPVAAGRRGGRGSMDREDARCAIDAVWRIESARLIAGLARIVGDVGIAEDLAQDALVAALEQWPRSGVPDNPGAWLMTTAKNRAIDRLRRGEMAARKEEELGREVELQARLAEPDLAAAADDDIGDDLLSLIFTASHPVLSTEARVALTLRLVGSLTTAEIARAFLAKESTVAQRIVRAKRTLAEARVPIEVPGAAEREQRLASVLEVVYAIFNEGYAASAGEDWIRGDLCEEAMRLGRILAGLAPTEPEALGLVALMELQAARFPARTGASGEAIPLLEQDRSRWDFVLIGRGLKALERAEALGRPLGPYALQAAIAACHARARTPEQTDWPRIVALYDGLAAITGSPVVRLNRAVAVGMAFGPAAGLELLDGLTSEPALDGYHLLPAARGELLERLGREEEAAAEFARAAALSGNARERELLQARAAGQLWAAFLAF